MSTVLICEPSADGHRMHYVRYVARALVERGADVMVATWDAAVHDPSYTAMEAACGGRVRWIRLADAGVSARRWRPGPLGTLERHLAFYRMFRRFWSATPEARRADMAFVPYLDYCDKAVALCGSPFGSAPWAGLVMRPSFQYRHTGVVAPRSALDMPEETLFRRLLRVRGLRALFTIDPPLYEYARARFGTDASRLHYAQDPADLGAMLPRTQARAVFGIAPDARVVLAAGTLTLRKGVDTLVAALHHPDTPPNVVGLLAGKQDTGVHDLLLQPAAAALRMAGRLVCVDRYLTTDELTAALCAADLAWLAYREHYASSGFLAQAAACGIPAIGCRDGLIGWEIGRRSQGVVIDATDAVAAAAALHGMIRSCPVRDGDQNDGWWNGSTFGARVAAHLDG